MLNLKYRGLYGVGNVKNIEKEMISLLYFQHLLNFIVKMDKYFEAVFWINSNHFVFENCSCGVFVFAYVHMIHSSILAEVLFCLENPR